ncbi:MAG: hypothetical protein AAF656_06935 [Planctomycetota bacterium]
MKLVPPKSEGSFYESFSDLIFCTLVLFIVIVMALVLKLGEAGGGGESGEARVSAEELDEALAAAEELEAQLAAAEEAKAEAERAKAEAEQAQADAEEAAAAAEEAAADATNELVFPNKFRGAAGTTYFRMVALDIEDQIWVGWVDAGTSARWDQSRAYGRDPVLEICQAVLDEELTIIPLEYFLRMAPDMGFEDYDEHMVMGTAISSAVQLAWQFQGEVKSAGRNAATRLRDLIGGKEFGTTQWYENHDASMRRLRADVLNAYRDHLNWSYGPSRNDPTYHHDLIDEKFRAVHPRANTASTWVRFTVADERRFGDKHVRVGSTVMTAKQFKNILRSYDPGGEFYVEYVDAQGEAADPPTWVMEEIMIPAGMNARIVNEDALQD